jgi:uncharacterized protein (TIRG00374 family)
MQTSPAQQASPTPPGKARWRRISAIVIGLAISAGFTWLLLRKVELGRVVAEIGRIHLPTLLLSLLSIFAGFLMMASRSAVLIRTVAPYDFYTLLKSVFVAFAGNNVLPLRAGEFLRIDYLARHGQASHSSCFAIIAVERLLDLVWLMLITLATAPLAVVNLPKLPVLLGTAAAIAASFGLLVLIAKLPERFVAFCGMLAGIAGQRVRGFVEQKARVFASGLASLRSASRIIGAASFTGGYWGTTLITIALIQAAFGFELPWYAPMVVIIFSAFAVILPSSPAYLGTYHYFVTMSMTSLGVGKTAALSFAVVIHAVGLLPFTLLSLVLLLGDLASAKGANEP